MNTNRKCLKQILAYLLMLVIIMENVCMPQYHIFAKTNTAVASDEEYIVGTGIFESPGHEFIENSEMNSVMPFSLMPEDYGNTSKVVHDQGFSLCCWAFAGVSLFEYKVDKEENDEL